MSNRVICLSQLKYTVCYCLQSTFWLSLGLLTVLTVSSCSQQAQGNQPITATSETAIAPLATPTATPMSQPTGPMATARPVTVPDTPVPFQPPDLGYLRSALEESLASFDGLASYYVVDLKGGQVAARNDDIAISGTSIVKIPILVEVYRTLNESPSIAEATLITETATLSGNYTANLLLELIAGQADPFAGAQQVTESMRRLGLYNTFIAVPYDLQPDPRYFSTYATPANQKQEVGTNPDSSMQTTASDMGRLLTFLYDCSMGHGYLIDVFGGALAPAECAEIIDVMSHNDIDAFIEEGVPAGVPVAHKHGWVGETHADAAIVQHADHPYILVIALHRPGWLEWAESTAIIAQLSRLTYAHFADSDAYAVETLRHSPPILPTVVPTPDLPMAIVTGTGGAGVVLRETPGGQEMMVVPEGSLVFLGEDSPAQEEGLIWHKIQLLGGVSGWVVADFLQAQ